MIRPRERQARIGFWIAASVVLHGAVLMAAPISLQQEPDQGARVRVTLEAPRPNATSTGQEASQRAPTSKASVPKQRRPQRSSSPEKPAVVATRPMRAQSGEPPKPAPQTQSTIPRREPEPEVAGTLDAGSQSALWSRIQPSGGFDEAPGIFEEMFRTAEDALGAAGGTGGPGSSSPAGGKSDGEARESQGDLRRPQGMSLARPDYPEESRARGEEGTVTLRVLVDTDGEVAQVKVAKSSGFQQLDRAASRGARRWRFAAARRGDVAIESWVEIGVVFRLEDETS